MVRAFEGGILDQALLFSGQTRRTAAWLAAYYTIALGVVAEG